MNTQNTENQANIILPKSFYRNNDVVLVAKMLLGKVICSQSDAGFCSAIITETEAYSGVLPDLACHAHLGKRTARTSTLFADGGTAYIYLCYGIHSLFNVVTNLETQPEAVLIRAAWPLDGLGLILSRRSQSNFHPKKTMGGPGTLTQALGIGTAYNQKLLDGPPLWIEERGFQTDIHNIQAGPRIGIDYAGADALLPWRFWLNRLAIQQMLTDYEL